LTFILFGFNSLKVKLNNSAIRGISSRTALDGELFISIISELEKLKKEFSQDIEVLTLIDWASFMMSKNLSIADFAVFLNRFLDEKYPDSLREAVQISVREISGKILKAIKKQRSRESRSQSWHTAFFHYPDPGSGVTGGTNTPHVARINFKNLTGEEVDPGFYSRNHLFKDKEIILRIHSACALSETLWHDDCDCCNQLSQTKDYIEDTGDGIILYLWQEGRGVGLAKKAAALSLTKSDEAMTADQALEVIAGNRDLRKYDFVSGILKGLGVDESTSIKLVSDNEDKYNALLSAGFDVDLISAVGTAKNLQAALEIAEKALSGSYQHSILIDSKSLEWISLE